jgi:hypothetical protein
MKIGVFIGKSGVYYAGGNHFPIFVIYTLAFYVARRNACETQGALEERIKDKS